ncbi:MAG: serine hydrolase [Planctomycetota bacterium]|nr:serine hydrolase [Planctomycetota bacterium]
MLARSLRLLVCGLSFALLSHTAQGGDWSADQIPHFPQGELPVRLFNGRDLGGWDGQKGKLFSVEDGEIVGRNSADNAPAASTYLVTARKYRNFRLVFESKLVTSEMHSGIALWGRNVEKGGDPFSYQGHLVMYPSGYGYYDLFRRNSIFQDTLGVAKRVGVQHDWNKMEILASGRRIRHVVNGTLVADWSDPQPELCDVGPIGLQLHSNTVAQEVRWRGLVLSENPQDVLITLAHRDAGLVTAGNPAESGMDAAALAKINDRMKRYITEKQVAGVVTLVARRGRVVHLDAVGHADIAENREMAKDSLFAIASMTKPITAAAVMILVDEGKLSLDDPVSKYIPGFSQTTLAEGKKPAREITIRDCLTHTNGLVSDQRNQGTLANTAEMLAKTNLAFDPGTKWQYGPGLSVAGRVAEVVSGKSFDDFLANRIFQPLQMKDTSFRPNADQAKRLAKLYQPTADKRGIEPGSHWLFELSPDTTPNPSGGLYSTAQDMVRFYQMILNGGSLEGQTILSWNAVRQMTLVQTGDLVTGFTPGNGWGLGFCVVREPQGATAAVGAGTHGHGGAFGTQGWIDPQKEMIYVLLIARQNFGSGDGADIRSEFQRLAVEAIRD